MPNLQTAIVCSPPLNPTIVHRLIFHLAFRTDADISHSKGVGRERDLQAWVASEDTTITPAGNLVGDDDTFGPGTNGNTSWDQFSANETLFGVKASFDEDVYTTKLDRSAPDFKERERKAQRIANEIIGVSRVGVCDCPWIFTPDRRLPPATPTLQKNEGSMSMTVVLMRRTSACFSHVVMELFFIRYHRYGAVVRGQNAYVPPGARKTGAGPESVISSAKGDVPKVSVNGPDGTAIAAQAQSPSSSKEPSPAPAAAGSVSNATDKVILLYCSKAGAYRICLNSPLLIHYLLSLLLLLTKGGA